MYHLPPLSNPPASASPPSSFTTKKQSQQQINNHHLPHRAAIQHSSRFFSLKMVIISSDDSPLVSARQIFKFLQKSSSLPCCLRILALQNLSSLMGRFQMMSMRRWLLCSIITPQQNYRGPLFDCAYITSIPFLRHYHPILCHILINHRNNWESRPKWPALLHS